MANDINVGYDAKDAARLCMVNASFDGSGLPFWEPDLEARVYMHLPNGDSACYNECFPLNEDVKSAIQNSVAKVFGITEPLRYRGEIAAVVDITTKKLISCYSINIDSLDKHDIKKRRYPADHEIPESLLNAIDRYVARKKSSRAKFSATVTFDSNENSIEIVEKPLLKGKKLF